MVCSKAILSTCCFFEMFVLAPGFDLSHIVTERHVFLRYILRKVNHIFSFYLFFSLLESSFLPWFEAFPEIIHLKYVLWFLYQAPDGFHNTCLKVSKSIPYIQVTLEFSFSFLSSPRLIVEVFHLFLISITKTSSWFSFRRTFHATKNGFHYFVSVTTLHRNDMLTYRGQVQITSTVIYSSLRMKKLKISSLCLMTFGLIMVITS